MLIISPSILAADFSRLGEVVKQADESGADYFHFDVMDGCFVPNISFGFPVLEAMDRITDKPLDVHLMIENPEKYIERFAAAGADIVTIHQEACVGHVKNTVDMIKSFGMKAGVAVKPHTDISALEPVLGDADMFLLMTVEPGFGGQKFMEFSLDKIHRLRNRLEAKGLTTDIQVDGGITKENFKTVIDVGANVIVMGSSVFGGDIKGNMEYFNSFK